VDRDEAAHLIDRQLCTVVPVLTRINEAAHAVGGASEWRAVLDAIQALHDKAMEAHKQATRGFND
jgi:hypothetical protein